MDRLIKQLKEKYVEDGYSQDFLDNFDVVNHLFAPENTQLINQYSKMTGFEIPSQIKDFYQFCGGLKLRNVHNSYFIYRLSFVLNTPKDYLPLRIDTEHGHRILPFGDNIGGEYFAISVDDGDKILYLQEALIDNGVYYSWPDSIYTVAPDFYTFLELIIEDTKAELRNDKTWKFMTDVRKD
jgi:hypothetical protein